MDLTLSSLALMLFWMGCKNTTVIYPEKKDIIETVYASGKIISANEYKLAALSNGTIIKKLDKNLKQLKEIDSQES